MDACDIAMMLSALIWTKVRKDRIYPDLVENFFHILTGLGKIHMAKDEASRELIVKEITNGPINNLIKLVYARAMEEDPAIRGELVKLVKGLDPQSTEYLMLPEAVKNLLKD